MRLIKPGSSQSGDDEINPEWSAGQCDNVGRWIARAERKGSEKQEVPKGNEVPAPPRAVQGLPTTRGLPTCPSAHLWISQEKRRWRKESKADGAE